MGAFRARFLSLVPIALALAGLSVFVVHGQSSVDQRLIVLGNGLPAVDAGMAGVFIRRGPWGWLHAARPEVSRATARIDSLTELPGLLRGLP